MDRLLISRLQKKFGLPTDAKFKGYVVHLMSSDEFLVGETSNGFADTYAWSKIPDIAKRFKKVSAAKKFVKSYGQSASVALLFEDDHKFYVQPDRGSFT